MGSDNKSPSYLEERDKARRALQATRQGRFAADTLKKYATPHEMSRTFDDDTWTDWEGVITEHKHDLEIAYSCEEARRSSEMARNSNSLRKSPMPSAAKWLKFFTPPLWYVLRRQVEMNDPDYWNDKKNVMREALDNLEWTTVPSSWIRAELNSLLPKERTIVTAYGEPVSSTPESGVLLPTP